LAKKKIAVKVKLLVSWAGADFSKVPGDVIEMPEEMAKEWIEAKAAELVEGDK
jgi:hypothetical protein